MSVVPSEAPATLSAKLKAVNLLAKNLEREYKEPTLQRMGDRVGIAIPNRPTGLAAFDQVVMQIGGLPKGRIIEAYGPESAGKTTVALQIVAEVQRSGGLAAFIDAEHALDPTWASKLGVDMDNLFVCQPNSGEQALQVMDRIIDTEAVDLVVLDSVAALAAQAELDGEVGDAHVGIVARLMGQTMRKIAGKLNKLGNRPTVVFINQIREKIGVMHGNPEVTPGGRALKFYASVRMDIRKKEFIKDGEEVIGSHIKIKNIKNKCASPYRECFVDLYFDDRHGHDVGFDKVGSWLDVAFDKGVVAKTDGTTFFFNRFDGKKMVADKVGVGEAASKAEIRSNPALLAAVQTEVKRIITSPPSVTA